MHGEKDCKNLHRLLVGGSTLLEIILNGKYNFVSTGMMHVISTYCGFNATGVPPFKKERQMLNFGRLVL